MVVVTRERHDCSCGGKVSSRTRGDRWIEGVVRLAYHEKEAGQVAISTSVIRPTAQASMTLVVVDMGMMLIEMLSDFWCPWILSHDQGLVVLRQGRLESLKLSSMLWTCSLRLCCLRDITRNVP